MKITKGKIILILIVIYAIFMNIKGLKRESNQDSKILDEVTIINDGKLDSDNEGKLVLVSGEIKYEQTPKFDELDAKWISSPIINRQVRKYVSDDDSLNLVDVVEDDIDKENIDDDKYYKYLYTTTKASDIQIGDYILESSNVIKLIKPTTYYNEQSEIAGLKQNAHYYTNNSDMDNKKAGDIEITYYYLDLNENKNISILGKQVGNTIEEYSLDSDTEVLNYYNEIITSKDELAKQLNIQTNKNFKMRFITIGLIIAIGIFFIVDATKGKKNN